VSCLVLLEPLDPIYGEVKVFRPVIVDYYKSHNLKSREVRWTKLWCRKLLLAARAGGNSLVADLVWTLS